MIIIIPVLSIIFILICFGLDKMTENWIGRDSFILWDLLISTFAPDVNQGRSMVEAILNTMSVIFGLLITVIGIILQLSVNRFTSHVTQLFFNNTIIGLFLTYILFCNCFSFWVYLTISDVYVPRTAVIMSLLMVITHLTGLFPFLAYLFYFLEPDQVVREIMVTGLAAAQDSINHHGRDLDKQQVRATMAVEHLMDAANSALKRKDKNITAEIVDALCSYLIHYGTFKTTMFKSWFKIPMWIRLGPDFLTLDPDAVQDLTDRRTWMEWKVLRQYQLLFLESLKIMKELCYHISMNTKIIGEQAAIKGDYHAVDLCLKFMNTFIRASLNAMDVRTVYNVLFQYRQLGESIIIQATKNEAENESKAIELEGRAIKLAKYLRYYSSLANQQKVAFLVEVIAQDMRVLCETAFHENR